MRYTGPKNRLSRQDGVDLELKSLGSKSHSRLIKKLNVRPGQHGVSRKRKLTGYGRQLREKQKLKRKYGLTEKQLKNYFLNANKTLGNTAEFLIRMIEHRLDNVVYRLGFAPTRASARQMITHGHICVNGKKNTFPSYRTKVSDTITFMSKQITEVPEIAAMLAKKDFLVQPWLERKELVGRIVSLYNLEQKDETIDLQSIVEFYSR